MDPLQNQQDFWQSRLAGAQLRADVPFAKSGEGGATSRQRVEIEAGLATALAARAEALEVDVDELLLLAWASMLARLAGVETLWTAVVHAGEATDDPWRLLAPLAVPCASTDSIETALPVLREASKDARAHAGLSRHDWETLLGGDATFQVGFEWLTPLDGGATSSRGMPVSPALDACGLLLVAGVAPDGPMAEIRVRGIPGEAHAASLLSACFSRWLRQLVADPSLGFGDVVLLEPEAARALLAKGSCHADLPDATCVHALFEAQANATPRAIAVVDGDRRLDYGELNRRANRLARHLRSLGAGPDARVAIYLDRHLELVVAVLATLKAGAAYVPLDPAYPVERLRHTLADCDAVAVVSHADLDDGWQALGDDAGLRLPRIDLATRAPDWDALPDTNLDPDEVGVLPRHLAYVLYTSGSTGKPKGVAMPHGPLVNLVLWQNRQPGHDVPLRTLQFAALGFDVAFQEMFSTLCIGGELHMVDGDTRLSGDRLHAFIAEHAIERIFLPYFALQMLAEGHANLSTGDDGASRPRCVLREVVTAGEQLRIEPRIRAFFEALPSCRLHNHYGPTETHVVTALALQGNPADWPRLPSIGTPIDNARTYLLDASGQPVPEGVAGELYLAGPVVARGYLGREDLSAERFLPDPFVDAPHARMYRTGDLARWQADGTLEFLGRRDFQVKIRGFRIELGEIEAQLMACPGVREAGVMVREDTPGMKRLVAYFTVLDADAPVRVERIREHLLSCLPDYMVPVAYVALDAMPLSPNGKLDRARLPAPGRARPEWAGEFKPARGPVEAAVCALFAETLDLERIGRDDNFFDLGGSSLLALHLLQSIRRQGLGEVGVTTLFRSPTPAGVARMLGDAGDRPVATPRFASGQRPGSGEDPIAIIAMAGRFPGADDVEAFWDNLCEGRDSIRFFSAGELDPSIDIAEREDPSYVAARGVIEGVEMFDAGFFGISPREAELMDPQQRIFLELCWACMERGGHVPGAGEGAVGVFAGMYNASYFQKHVSAYPDRIERLGAFQVMLDNEKDYIATRVAHKLDLTGPAISIHTACSTSLVAIAQAVDSLRAGRCDMALAGGASVTCPPRSGYRYQEGAMLSPDGHTRTFDADAQGTVFCDGAAVVLLKRLSDALADGDPVHAVIRGVGINNDGGDKASFTAPSSEAQSAVVAMAHADAGVEPDTIGYVEAHGTATPLGDPIEIEGLTRAFRRGTDARGFCRIGSVKSNVGHLLIAAGAAGVIKTALSLEKQLIPATLHYRAPNPALDLEASPFVVNATRTPWPAGKAVRRAGVSSFGVGGTNAHVVLEEAPVREASEQTPGPKLLLLSARTPAALQASVDRLATHLEQDPGQNLDDVAWTLAMGRKAFAHRVSIVADDAVEAASLLRGKVVAAQAARSRPARADGVVFMFPGQGATYARMGCGLRESEPAFREALEACGAALGADFGFDLLERLASDESDALLPTSVMQPATFAIEYALARWWQSQGIEPVAMIGHSVGEFVAATLAGVFSLHDAIRLVARRGALMQAQPGGGMLSVRLDRETLEARLPQGVSLAAENAPAACVVAGTDAQLEDFRRALEADGIACRLLHTSHAFHSAMMAPAVAPFRAEVEGVERHPPRCPIVSTTTGEWLDETLATSPDYWASHLREPVLFSRALSTVLESPTAALLEVGPRTNLASLARMHAQVSRQHVPLVSSLSDDSASEARHLRRALGGLWSGGIALRPGRLDTRGSRRRVRLPTYPFERQRFWLDAPSATRNVVQLPAAAAAQENPMPHLVTANDSLPSATPVPPAPDRKARLVTQLRGAIEDVSGIDMDDAEAEANFIEIGLDSLVLTQVALQLQKTFATKVTFRQLMSDTSSLASLAAYLDSQMPAETAPAAAASVPAPAVSAAPVPSIDAVPEPLPAPAAGALQAGGQDRALVQQVIAQQMQLMSQQLALLGGAAPLAPAASAGSAAMAPAPASMPAVDTPVPATAVQDATPAAAGEGDDETAAIAHTRYDLKKAFGAIARIDSNGQLELGTAQRAALDAFMARYVARTPRSKAYTSRHRKHMADPRVVNGFRPLTKEIVYQIVIERSRGPRMWDLDGNEYVDALNGFGMSLFGWQPDFIMDAVRRQLDQGIDIGPQHPLAGEVSEMICELTGHDRAALCNTGSEAVLGALRLARTVTGRETLVVFNGSYHGIIDEVIVRGTRKLKSVPAAPGILRNTAEHVLVLDYGTPEAMQVIRERAHEIAAVLVEPVQSRRPDFRPVEFLRELREVTAEAGAALIFDEVITGFRAHPGGTQAMFGVKADIATYGKVVGGGQPIGAIAGSREFMDALDGGQWEYGDDSVPTVGVTYFAGTFVRHPMALAAAHAVLTEMKKQGGALQEGLNARTTAMVEEINAFCASRGAPVEVRHFASVWKTFFLEDHPLQDLLFPMMRSRGIHILDNFPCFLTTAHEDADLRAIIEAFKASIVELQEWGFLPGQAVAAENAGTVMDPARPPVPGARIGRDPEGRPAWYVADPDRVDQYVKVG